MGKCPAAQLPGCRHSLPPQWETGEPKPQASKHLEGAPHPSPGPIHHVVDVVKPHVMVLEERVMEEGGSQPRGFFLGMWPLLGDIPCLPPAPQQTAWRQHIVGSWLVWVFQVSSAGLSGGQNPLVSNLASHWGTIYEQHLL